MWYRYFVPSVLWHCWLGNRKGIRRVQSWVLVCWRWRFDCSIGRNKLDKRVLSPPPPGSIMLSSNNIQNGDTLIPAYLSCPINRPALNEWCQFASLLTTTAAAVDQWRRKQFASGGHKAGRWPKFFLMCPNFSLEGAQRLIVTDWETIMKCPLVSALQCAHLLVKSGEKQ